MRGSFALALGLAACAQASPGQHIVHTDKDAPVGGDDDSGGGDIDAPHVDIDAPGLTAVTLSESANNIVDTQSSLACGGADANNNPYTTENSWYRVFKLSDFGITNVLHVSDIQFGIQEASAGASVQIKIGTYSGATGGTLNLAQVTPINSTTVPLAADTTAQLADAPLVADIPAGSSIIVEIFSPDHTAQPGLYFYAGASTGTETAPSYFRTPACNNAAPQPVPMKSIQGTAGALVMNVIGKH